MKTITRAEAIEKLRRQCMALVDDDHSLCQVAAKLKIMCGGFSQYTTAELRERYDWIVKSRPGIKREELEELANRWQLARQYVNEKGISCDNQQTESNHPTCHGWDEHTDEEIERYMLEVCGEEVKLVPQAS
jgi:hypothetical protein